MQSFTNTENLSPSPQNNSEISYQAQLKEWMGLSEFEIFQKLLLIENETYLEKFIKMQKPEMLWRMVTAGGNWSGDARYYCAAYRSAAKKGNLAFLKCLESLVSWPDKHKFTPKFFRMGNVKEAITDNVECAYGEAAINGHLEVLVYLESILPPESINKALNNSNFEAYRLAAENGHLAILKHIASKIPEDTILSMIEAQPASYTWADPKFHGGRGPFYAYRNAAMNGHFEILVHIESYLKSIDPKFLEILVDESGAYVCAPNLETMKHLESIVEPQAFQRIVEKSGVPSVCIANLEALKHLESITEPQVFQKIIQQYDYYVYRKAFEGGHVAICQHLLRLSSGCFAYAESHVPEYGNFIQPFIRDMLNELHSQAQNLAPDAVFNIENSEQARLCFYIIRHCIRLDGRTWGNELRFLLNIPAVKALAHLEVTNGQSNELLRLAQSYNNTEAASILLNIPAVRQLAEQENYYRSEQTRGIDLRRLAADHESSMTALSQGEQNRLQAFTNYYEPILKEKGVAKLIDELRNQLIARYKANPAFIHTTDGKKIELPMDFAEFNQSIPAGSSNYQNALIAYYQHKDHTAWRYLAIPNQWMNQQASYVYIDSHGQRYSTFEEYQPLIVMLWMAALDKAMLPVRGTIEERLVHFIDELALIGRSHNWDKTRPNSITGKLEEYDDLTGDKPSCFSGVKRRLFQSVIDHPLLGSLLTADVVVNEIREFARAHFDSQISIHNKAQLKEAFDDYLINIADMSENSKAVLALFNIAEVKIQAFEQYLVRKYGVGYTADDKLRKIVREKIYLNSSVPQCGYHALMLESFVGLYDKLSQPETEENMIIDSPSSNQIISETDEMEIVEDNTVSNLAVCGLFGNANKRKKSDQQVVEDNESGIGLMRQFNN